MSTDGLTLELEINPVPLARPRVNTTTSRAYTTAASRAFAEEFQWLVLAQRATLPVPIPLDGDLSLGMRFWRRHVPPNGKRGDLDNLVKAVLDAGNGLLWRDDAQIVDLHARFVQTGPTVIGRVELELHRFDARHAVDTSAAPSTERTRSCDHESARSSEVPW